MTEKQFKETFLPRSEGMYRVALHLLEDEAMAKDALQDLLLRLFIARDSLEVPRNPGAWCNVSIRNLCLDRIRARENKGRTVSRDPIPDCPSSYPDPEELLAQRDLLSRVEDAIEDLPSRERTVLRRRVFEGEQYEKISKDTGLSEGNLRYLLSRARSRLREKLKD